MRKEKIQILLIDPASSEITTIVILLSSIFLSKI